MKYLSEIYSNKIDLALKGMNYALKKSMKMQTLYDLSRYNADEIYTYLITMYEDYEAKEILASTIIVAEANGLNLKNSNKYKIWKDLNDIEPRLLYTYNCIIRDADVLSDEIIKLKHKPINMVAMLYVIYYTGIYHIKFEEIGKIVLCHGNGGVILVAHQDIFEELTIIMSQLQPILKDRIEIIRNAAYILKEI